MFLKAFRTPVCRHSDNLKVVLLALGQCMYPCSPFVRKNAGCIIPNRKFEKNMSNGCDSMNRHGNANGTKDAI